MSGNELRIDYSTIDRDFFYDQYKKLRELDANLEKAAEAKRTSGVIAGPEALAFEKLDNWEKRADQIHSMIAALTEAAATLEVLDPIREETKHIREVALRGRMRPQLEIVEKKLEERYEKIGAKVKIKSVWSDGNHQGFNVAVTLLQRPLSKAIEFHIKHRLRSNELSEDNVRRLDNSLNNHLGNIEDLLEEGLVGLRGTHISGKQDTPSDELLKKIFPRRPTVELYRGEKEGARKKWVISSPQGNHYVRSLGKGLLELKGWKLTETVEITYRTYDDRRKAYFIKTSGEPSQWSQPLKSRYREVATVEGVVLATDNKIAGLEKHQEVELVKELAPDYETTWASEEDRRILQKAGVVATPWGVTVKGRPMAYALAGDQGIVLALQKEDATDNKHGLSEKPRYLWVRRTLANGETKNERRFFSAGRWRGPEVEDKWLL